MNYLQAKRGIGLMNIFCYFQFKTAITLPLLLPEWLIYKVLTLRNNAAMPTSN